ncbi:MAG: aminopeptidase P family protein [Alphaproteobacteria bacterium]|nr:aminopeptidase P family protein [Alphaproteobacteria bacterium]
MHRFSDREMTRRLDDIRDLMDFMGLDAVVASSFHNVLYYSNFWMTPFGRGHFAVIPRRGDPAVIAPRIEFDRPKKLSWFEDVRIYWDARSPLDGALKHIGDTLKDRGIERGRIGIEEYYIPFSLYKGLATVMVGSEFVDVSRPIMRKQIVKSKEEIVHIRQGAEIATRGAEAFETAIAEGVSEIDVARTAVTVMEREIADRFPEAEQDGTFAWCQFGTEHTYVAHNPNTTRKLAADEIVSLNVFPMVAGYYHLLERSLFFGTMPDHVRKPFEVCSEAHEAGIAAVRPGVRCNEIDDHVNPIFEKAGYLGDRTFGTGHSFGIMGQWYGRDEIGELRPYNDTVLEEDMVISIEPMISVVGAGGFRHADMLLVTGDGAEVLTAFKRGVIQI